MAAAASIGSPIGDDGEAEELIAIATDNRDQHFVGVQLKPVKQNPHKRSAYKVLESAGLHSHFHSPAATDDTSSNSDTLDDLSLFHPLATRTKRDANLKLEQNGQETNTNEALPTAAAQTMEAGYYRKARSRLSEDSMVAVSDPQGLRRMPRVNFVTQPRSIPDDVPEHRDLKASNANMGPMYRPMYDSYMPQPYPRGRGRFFDNYAPPASYDRYDSMSRDYGNPRFDPYYMRQPQNGGYYGYYRDPMYYDYPYPENRGSGYPGNYGNAPLGYPSSPNRRVIYYAHLPEVVNRNSPYGGDSRGGYYQNMRGGMPSDDPYYEYSQPAYSDDYNYRYHRDMTHYGPPPPVRSQPAPSVIYSNRDRDNNRIPDRDDGQKTNGKEPESKKTQTVSSGVRVEENSHRNYDSSNHQAPSSDFTQPHYRME